MINIKLTVQYDGTNYAGFQVQPNVATIQGEIENALEKIYGTYIHIQGAGRTDAGVHALGQVAGFCLENLKMPISKLHQAINYYLPRDIRAISAEEEGDSFHARFSAKWREYIYVIDNSDIFVPFYDKYAYFYYKHKINTEVVNEYGKLLLGEHDFTSFCSSADENEVKFRYIERLYTIRKGNFVYLIIRGNAFLHNMVRIITGTLLELEHKKLPYKTILEILSAKDRTKALITAPAKGLYFRRVIY